MSQSDFAPQPTAQNHAAAHAVKSHHARLAAQLDQRVETLLSHADLRDQNAAEDARQGLLGYLRHEILPHARAEEQALYPPAAALPEGRLLVEGMLDEHRALTALVHELAGVNSPARAAAAGRALAALFAAHLVKENELVLPLLTAAPGVRLAEILAGMHDLLGVGVGDGASHEVEQATRGAGDCGGEGCGCGGDRASSSAEAPALSMDRRLDVREVPHSRRHALVLSTVAALPPGEAVVLVASHAPRPVLAEIDVRFGGQMQIQWLQSGPEVWQVRLERVAVTA